MIARYVNNGRTTKVAHKHPHIIVETDIGVGNNSLLSDSIIHRGLIEPECHAHAHIVGDGRPGDIAVSPAVRDVDTVHIVVDDLAVGHIDVASAVVDVEASDVVVPGDLGLAEEKDKTK